MLQDLYHRPLQTQVAYFSKPTCVLFGGPTGTVIYPILTPSTCGCCGILLGSAQELPRDQTIPAMQQDPPRSQHSKFDHEFSQILPTSSQKDVAGWWLTYPPEKYESQLG